MARHSTGVDGVGAVPDGGHRRGSPFIPSGSRTIVITALILAVSMASVLAGCRSQPALRPAAASAPTTSPGRPTPVTTAPAPSSSSTVAPIGPATNPDVAPTAATPTTCRVRGAAPFVLPDPACTPGAINPAVTPATIDSTICVKGWTATVRPPESYTEELKRSQMQAYGDTGSLSSYEEDHLVPLELGGAPSDPRNLWPEPGGSPNQKDSVEDAARQAVCDGSLALATAQTAIAADWVALGQRLGVLADGGSPGAPTNVPGTQPVGSQPAGSQPAGSQPVSSPPNPTPIPTAGSPPAATSGPGPCSPVTASGHCYSKGEYCPDADHNVSGTDADGRPITCTYSDGWRWE